MVTRFIEHLQDVTTSDYNSFINSHTLQFTRAYTEVISACFVFTSFLVTASKDKYSPPHGFPNCPRNLATAALH
jgi:hypothetical protein